MTLNWAHPSSGLLSGSVSTSELPGRGVSGAALLGQRAAGPSLVLLSSAAIQVSAVLSVTVFASVGALATSGLRFFLAAIILLAVARPRLRGRS